MSTDRLWMYDRVAPDGTTLTDAFELGVEFFLEFAYKHPACVDKGKIRCPCKTCMNVRKLERDAVKLHLFQKGFMGFYSRWTHHGEPIEPETTSNYEDAYVGNDADTYQYRDMVMDAAGPDFGWDTIDGDDVIMEEEPNLNANKFYQLLNDADEPLYDGHQLHSKLSAVSNLLHFKSESGCSEKHFNALLEFIDEILPKGHKLPTSYYYVKKMVRALGLGYEKIDACEHDCILYYAEHKDLQECPTCHTPRYEEHTGEGKGKPIPRKILRYFPLAPRLQRLYMSSKTSDHMRWHSTSKKTPGELRHPSDGEAWKKFDEDHTSFAVEARNVRLALATDGFNPYGHSSNPHSTWPVITVPYNLPPWMCMKEPYMFLSLLIPGPRSPGRDIDVYLRPLIDELKLLWEVGVETYDISLKQNFQMRAAVMWTINDFPAYGIMEGWSVHSLMACPVCKDENKSFRLKHGGKTSFFGCHRRFLPYDHPLRKQKKEFDNTIEKRGPPTRLSSDLCADWVNGIDFPHHGKLFNDHRAEGFGVTHNWTKRSILFDLPYWSTLTLRHNLDVMHIEKNVFENVFNTVMGFPGKTKDNVKARRDLEEMNIRPELHLLNKNGTKVTLPRASYCLTKDQVKLVCEWVKQLKMPDGYASNISRCCNLTDCKFYGLKSHDCHVFMQKLIPVAFRELLPPKVVEALTELCHFFRDLCCTVLREKDLDILEKNIRMTISKLEKIFPPGFFDCMEHLPIHLPYEAKVGGPVQYRWMYPFERYMKRLKGTVRNKARPEGSIAEAYIIDELVNFSSLYFDINKSTKHNRLHRNEDAESGGLHDCLDIFRKSGRMLRRSEKHSRYLTSEEYNAAELYAALNCSGMEPYINEFDEEALAKYPNINEDNLGDFRNKSFIKWFKDRVHRDSNIDPRLKDIAYGPSRLVQVFKGYIVNGFRFHTADVDSKRKTQNSGVLIKGSCYEDVDTDFYGKLVDIIELSYPNNNYLVMFKCDWFDITKGVTKDKNGIVQVNMKSRLGSYEPFVLASQASQVFYAKSVKKNNPNWYTVMKTRSRSTYDMPDDDEIDTTMEETYQEDEPPIVTPINNEIDAIDLRGEGTVEEDEAEAGRELNFDDEAAEEEYEDEVEKEPESDFCTDEED